MFLTGASSGIGQATAIECSRLGARCIISGRNTARLEETLDRLEKGHNHEAYAADLTNDDDIVRLVEQLPTLDGAVLCAGQGFTAPIKNAKRKRYEAAMEVNFFSPVALMQTLLAKKILARNASVILIASVGGTTLFEPANAVYGASKAALNSYVRFAASELSTTGIRVNAICPGMVNTPLIHRGIYTKEQLEVDAAKYPLGRYGEPRDVALAAVYVLSDAASWMTGTSLVIDGGISINKK